MQMVLPLDVNFLVSNSLNMHSHNQQLLEMASAGTAIVIPAWETTVPRTTGRQIATDLVQGKHPMLCYLQACADHSITAAMCIIWRRASGKGNLSALVLDTEPPSSAHSKLQLCCIAIGAAISVPILFDRAPATSCAARSALKPDSNQGTCRDCRLKSSPCEGCLRRRHRGNGCQVSSSQAACE